MMDSRCVAGVLRNAHVCEQPTVSWGPHTFCLDRIFRRTKPLLNARRIYPLRLKLHGRVGSVQAEAVDLEI